MIRIILLITFMLLAFNSNSKTVCDKDWLNENEVICQEWPDDDAVRVDDKHQTLNRPQSSLQVTICEYSENGDLSCHDL